MPTPIWMETWRTISREADHARDVMTANRKKGEDEFRALMNRHGEDGMIFLKRGEAYEKLGQPALAFGDYLEAESHFPMEDWKDTARKAAARVEAELPPYSRDTRLNRGLKILIPDQEIGNLLQKTFKFIDSDPQISIRTARSVIAAIIRRIGASNSIPRGGLDQDGQEGEIERLLNSGKIPEIAAVEMHCIRRIRNEIEYKSGKATPDDARACAYFLKAILQRTKEMLG